MGADASSKPIKPAGRSSEIPPMPRRSRSHRKGAKSAIAVAILAAFVFGGWWGTTAHAAGPQTAAGVERPGLEDERMGDLRTSYDEFRAERRRSLARDVATWIQTETRYHYVDDGPVDRWATFEETLERNGDDCDGLELLTSHFLRELGFPEDEVFRAIVFRKTDGQHHMVTLWFEDREDPWVIDPTGAMTSGMPRMSEIPGWVPLRVFSESLAFTVRERPLVPTVTAR